MPEETVELKTYEIEFGTKRGSCTAPPYRSVIVEAANYVEAQQKVAVLLSNKYNSWVFYAP